MRPAPCTLNPACVACPLHPACAACPLACQVLDHAGLQGLREFHNEMQLSCSIQHPSVVKLLGYAHEGSCQCLVYELMAHGNLEDRLTCKVGGRGGGGFNPGPWLEVWLPPACMS